MAAGDIGEFPFDGGADRKTVAPFHFGGGGGERGITRLRDAADDKARPRQGRERWRDCVVRIEIMGRRGTSAQRNANATQPNTVAWNVTPEVNRNLQAMLQRGQKIVILWSIHKL